MGVFFLLQNERTKRLVLAAMFCALTFLGTCLAFPTPLGGNLNFGDGILLICAWTMGMPWGFAAAIGAAMSDLIGYAVYAPATLIIKALMVVAAVLLRKVFDRTRLPGLLSKIFSAVCAEVIMVVGYYLFEAIFIVDSFVVPLANIPFNLIQALFAIIIACLATLREKKIKI